MSIADQQAWLFVATLFLLGALVIQVFGSANPGPASRTELWAYFRSEFLIVALVMGPASVHRWAVVLVAVLAWCRFAWEIRLAGGQRPQAAPARDLLALAVVSLCTTAFAALDLQPNGVAWLVFMFICTEVQDSMAFLIGRLFGRTKIFPRLSPKKTVAGTVGGLSLGVLAGALFASLVLRMPWGLALVAALVCNAAGLAGDLLASAFKRDVGIKDYPSVHRLHGGLLDIYDSLIFTAPWALAVVWLAGATTR